jgi:hypothetical protein
VSCCDATASYFVAKVWAKSAHFYAFAVKRRSSMRNWLFGLPGRILCEQSVKESVKESNEHALDFALQLSNPYLVSVSLDFTCTAHAFFPEHLSNHCQDLHLTFPKICTKFDAAPLSDPFQNCIRPEKRLKIKVTMELTTTQEANSC